MALAVALATLAPVAIAQLEVNIGRGTFKPTPVAIPNFEAIGLSLKWRKRLATCSRRSRIDRSVTITPEDAHIQKDLNIEVAPRFADWKIIQTDALVVGTVELIERDGNQLVRGSVRMWDVYGEELMRLKILPVVRSPAVASPQRPKMFAGLRIKSLTRSIPA